MCLCVDSCQRLWNQSSRQSSSCCTCITWWGRSFSASSKRGRVACWRYTSDVLFILHQRYHLVLSFSWWIFVHFVLCCYFRLVLPSMRCCRQLTNTVSISATWTRSAISCITLNTCTLETAWRSRWAFDVSLEHSSVTTTIQSSFIYRAFFTHANLTKCCTKHQNTTHNQWNNKNNNILKVRTHHCQSVS